MQPFARALLWMSVGATMTVSAVTCSDLTHRHYAPDQLVQTTKADKPQTRFHSATPKFARTPQSNLADVAETAVDGVVNIATERHRLSHESPFFQDPMFRRFFGDPFGPPDPGEVNLGSGLIISEDGLLITNFHVVDKADRVVVTLSTGLETEASVVGVDPESDLAVLRLNEQVEGLKPLKFGDSEALRLGDIVLAIGNPFGVGQTVTMGIVSAKGRANMGIVDYEDFIQTDAAINPGNSGGPLINMSGEVVGVNTAIVSQTGGYQGLGFAIPSTMAQRITNSLITKGRVVRGWLGVAIQDITPDLAAALDIEQTAGVIISDVTPNSPAERAGLQQGDVVLRLNSTEITSSGQFRNAIAAAGADTQVQLDVLRNGARQVIDARLGERQTTTTPDLPPPPTQEEELSGLTLAPLNPSTRQKYQIAESIERGVVVTEVMPGSMAARSGLRPGDVIMEMDRKRVTSVRELLKIYEQANDTVAVVVQRGDSPLFLALRKNG